jgi:hypothetical protein
MGQASSAAIKIDCGTSRPSAFAVRMFTINSNLVGRDNSRGRGCRLHRATRNHLPDWMTDKWRASCASFVGMPFKTVDEALEAISREFKAIGSGGALAVVAGRTAATPNRALRGHVARLASTISYR